MQKNKLNLHIYGIHLLNPYKTVVSHLKLSGVPLVQYTVYIQLSILTHGMTLTCNSKNIFSCSFIHFQATIIIISFLAQVHSMSFHPSEKIVQNIPLTKAVLRKNSPVTLFEIKLCSWERYCCLRIPTLLPLSTNLKEIYYY